MKQRHHVITICLTVLFLHGCNANNFVIDDLENLIQDHGSYIKTLNTKKIHIPKNYHQLIDASFNKKFFSPWNTKRNYVKRRYIQRVFSHYKEKEGYGENKQKVEKDWVIKIEKNANLKKFPNFKRKGITVANTNLRTLPTNKPHFNKFSDNSNGFPFDNLQNSTLPANSPIYITHISLDNAWVFVETAYANGWVTIRDIAYAGPKFIKQFKTHRKFIAVTKDDIPIKTISGTYLFQANIGMIFPLIKENGSSYHIATSMANSKRYAYIKTASIKKQNSQKKPLPLTTKNIAYLCDQLINQSYGWGGLYSNRDCSAMIRDLFTPFGIWLPRNSGSQAKTGGLFFDLSHMTNNKKEEFIKNNGLPYLTLLWFPGHIMLYIGEQANDPLVFHNIWGLRTKTKKKREIIGKSVITTLTPGKELPNIDKKASLLNRVQGMTLLVPRYL